MLVPGKRPYYVIHFLSRGDDTYSGLYLITRNKKEALTFFKWLYDIRVVEEWMGDDNVEDYDRNYQIRNHEDDVNKITGNFYYSNDEYTLDCFLHTIYTDTTLGWNNNPDPRIMDKYNRYKANMNLL